MKKIFGLKDLGKTKLCLSLQIKHVPNGMLIQKLTYTKKVLKRFHRDKSHPLSSLMVIWLHEVKNNSFHFKEDNEKLFGLEVLYLSVNSALVYLAYCMRPNIAFSVSVLTIYSFAPIWGHCNEAKHKLQYLRGKIDIGLFYKKWLESQ